MDKMWNDTGKRLWPLTFRGRFRAFCACVETYNFGFVSAELYPCLSTPCLACVYHHLEFASISWDQTQIVNVKNSPYPPDPPIVGDGCIGEFTFSSWIKSASKIPKRVELNLFPSGFPRRMSTLLLLGIRGWRTRTLTVWNHSLRCFHILPTIFSLHWLMLLLLHRKK